jgi:hypothetical protein
MRQMRSRTSELLPMLLLRSLLSRFRVPNRIRMVVCIWQFVSERCRATVRVTTAVLVSSGRTGSLVQYRSNAKDA